MNIDERLDRLVDRQEALAQSVELLSIETRELGAAIAQDTENIRKLTSAISQDAENTRALARVAEIHERRLTHLEGGEEQR